MAFSNKPHVSGADLAHIRLNLLVKFSDMCDPTEMQILALCGPACISNAIDYVILSFLTTVIG